MGKTAIRKWIADLCCSHLGHIHILFCIMEQEGMYTKQASGDCSSVDMIVVWIFLGMRREQKKNSYQ
jgi:hypothetical protein